MSNYLKVMKNLHVVFTMNPSTDGLKDRAATSPALFNRCVLNWFGDWSDYAFFQVGKELAMTLFVCSGSTTHPRIKDRPPATMATTSSHSNSRCSSPR